MKLLTTEYITIYMDCEFWYNKDHIAGTLTNTIETGAITRRDTNTDGSMDFNSITQIVKYRPAIVNPTYCEALAVTLHMLPVKRLILQYR